MEDVKYKVGLIHGEQARVSTATQCAYLLKHLENVMDEVFNSIMTRINENASKVNDLNHRAKVAYAKVEKLKGCSNAIQVFSSAVYPGEDNYSPFKGLLTSDAKPDSMQKLKESGTLFQPTDYDPALIKEKLSFFHVHDHRDRHSAPMRSGRKEGLGRLPKHLSSVSALLLYNTTHNPYNEYILLDPLGVIAGTRGEAKASDDTNNIYEAPVSIKEGDQRIQLTKDEFQYLPDLSDLPELDLPHELPSLSGIANDLWYQADEGPSIAPSMGFPDLPVYESVAFSSQPSYPPPPSPPPPPSQPQPSSQFKELNSSPPVPHPPPVQPLDVPPPPPPPPPPPLSVVHPTLETSDGGATAPALPKPQGVPVEAIGNSRTNLMKAIQEAGGAGKAKLRKVNPHTPEAEKVTAPQSKTSPPGGDLMSDLFAKLSQRRKGISGNPSVIKETKSPSDAEPPHSNGAQSTMQKISSVIPPPPIANDVDSDAKLSDDDWA